MPDPVRLRGHHLLCILTHSGSGYTSEFIDNLHHQIDRINNGSEVEIVSGTDDICAALIKAGAAACDHSRICTIGKVIKTHDQLALHAISKELQMPSLQAGERFNLGKGEVRYLREAFAAGDIRSGCKGCPWHDACSEVANNNFSSVKLMPEAVPNPLHPQRRPNARPG